MPVLKCFSCGRSTPETSLKICGQYLCRGCEKKLLRSNAGKTDYQHWIKSCRRFWEDLESDCGSNEG